MLIIETNNNTIEAVLTIELVVAVVCWSTINAEIVAISIGISPC
jgi:hypothetical protein